MKLAVMEDDSERASELWTMQRQLASTILSYPEGRAAIAAALRAGRLTRGGYKMAVKDFEAIHGELTLIGVDTALSHHAGELAEEFALRGYDAVHLASAAALGAGTTLVTWDKDLARAALQAGLQVAPQV